MEHPPVTMVTHSDVISCLQRDRFVAVRQCSPIFLRANIKDVCVCVCSLISNGDVTAVSQLTLLLL